MNNQEIINIISRMQSLRNMHPLTCGNDSRHRRLYGAEKDGKIILKCPDCNYEQENFPLMDEKMLERFESQII